MPESPLQDLRILVIDNGGKRGELLEGMLSEIGAGAVTRVPSPGAALSQLAGQRFDLVFGHMDDSDHDIEGFARALRGAEANPNRETPILLIVDTPDRSELLSALDAGITGFVVGGLTPERLRSQILGVLQSYGPL